MEELSSKIIGAYRPLLPVVTDSEVRKSISDVLSCAYANTTTITRRCYLVCQMQELAWHDRKENAERLEHLREQITQADATIAAQIDELVCLLDSVSDSVEDARKLLEE